MRGLIPFVVALACAASAAAQDFRVEATAANELRALCSEDRGQLWGVDLCGPLLVVDPTTRRAWGSAPDNSGALRNAGAGWVGDLPAGTPIANTALDWSGQRWIMLIAPLPDDAQERRVLLAHEAWHRAQDHLGLSPAEGDCVHLESERGRYLMRLEMRALSVAMRSSNRARRNAGEDALLFRAARLAAFPNAQFGERALDRNEGLAAYTGVMLGADNATMYAASVLDRYDTHQALARAYAQATGPAYGLLLDQYRRAWRGELNRGASAADLLAATLEARTPNASALNEAAVRYGGPGIAIEENARAQAQRTRIAALQTRFGAGPRVELPLSQMRMEFNPNLVTPVEGLGALYEVLTLRDVWGEFRATSGALISPDSTRAVLAEPVGEGLAGPGWTLSLAPGYRLVGPGPDGAYRPLLIPQAE